MDFIGTLRGAITWLGGAVAGLTVLCYGAGYFALHSYLAMLGLNEIVAVTPDQMLSEGADFWLSLISELLRYLAFAIVITIVVVVSYLLLQHVQLVKRPAQATARKARNSWAWLSDRYTGIGSIAVLLLFLALLSWHYDSYFEALRSLSGSAVPQQQSTGERHLAPLLFQAPAAVVPGSSKPAGCASTREADPDQFGATARALVTRGETCREELVEGAFHYLVQGFFVLILVLLLTFSRKLDAQMSRRASVLVRGGAAFYFGVYTLSLPGAFGMLVHEPIYPRVMISGPGLSAEGYRLFQDDRSLLIWSPVDHKITWLPIQRVNAMQSQGPQNIFDKP